MSRKRCRRQPRPLVNPITTAIAGAAITPEALLNQVRMTELSALEAFRTGHATVDDWRALADMSNVAQTFVRMGVGPEVQAVTEAMEEHLSSSHTRYTETGRLGLTGPGLTAARELYEYHDLQRTSVSRSEYEVAIQKTAARIRSAAADVKVLIS